jgi:hypothetical protein
MYFYALNYQNMKYPLIFIFFMAIVVQGKCQDSPKPADPCQQLDTNKIKLLILGTWVDRKDTNHVLIITEDSLTERIQIGDGMNKKINTSYFSYKFTDNIFSSDAVTCYSIVEYVPGYPNHTDFAINSVTQNYLLLGSTGKVVFKRRN